MLRENCFLDTFSGYSKRPIIKVIRGSKLQFAAVEVNVWSLSNLFQLNYDKKELVINYGRLKTKVGSFPSTSRTCYSG